MSRAKDMTGMVFGRLTVQRQVGCNANGFALWECACACGRTHVVSRLALVVKVNPTRSCGCLKREMARAQMFANNPRKRYWLE